ncbi:hypothetical protein [Pseudomonas sp. DSP3-2-2]|uniref:hypothetical protein n=1 Tax=unclassified Pseudomonas TaxID=196821 RepID=UPI003CEB47F0
MRQAKATLIEISYASNSQPLTNGIIIFPGPKAITVAIDSALLTVEGEIRAAVSDFSQAIDMQEDVSAIGAFSAMLYAFKQNGVDMRTIGEAVYPHS